MNETKVAGKRGLRQNENLFFSAKSLPQKNEREREKAEAVKERMNELCIIFVCVLVWSTLVTQKQGMDVTVSSWSCVSGLCLRVFLFLSSSCCSSDRLCCSIIGI